jgi:hypothetical protein
MDRGCECPDELLVYFQPSLATQHFYQQVEGPVVDLQIIDEDDERTFDNGKVEDLSLRAGPLLRFFDEDLSLRFFDIQRRCNRLIRMDGLRQLPTQEDNAKDHQQETPNGVNGLDVHQNKIHINNIWCV